jgi:acetyltransferase-like isoleucine patch superfamily enzyme
MSQSLPRAPVAVPTSTVIGEHCTLGFPKEARLRQHQATGVMAALAPVVLGERCLVFNQVVIYEGVHIGNDCVIEDRVRIGYDNRIGCGVRLVYGAYLCDRVTVGDDARIAGFICDGTLIGPRSTVMGELVHEYSQPHRDWWEVDETSPVVEADVVVGYGARVVGGVRIGPYSYVAAGAIVTKDVPPEHIVTGTNVQTPAAEWGGERLQDLIRHWRRDRATR